MLLLNLCIVNHSNHNFFFCKQNSRNTKNSNILYLFCCRYILNIICVYTPQAWYWSHNKLHRFLLYTFYTPHLYSIYIELLLMENIQRINSLSASHNFNIIILFINDLPFHKGFQIWNRIYYQRLDFIRQRLILF